MMGAWVPEDDETKTATTVMDIWKQNKDGKKSFLLCYAGIEAAWHVALFTACYRYRPFMHLSKSASGQKFLTSLRRRIGCSSSSQKSSLLPSSFYQKNYRWTSWIPPKRTVVAASEWFFFNKVIGIPLWPTKILLAGWIHNKLSLQLSLEAAERPINIRHQEENEGSFVQ